MTIRGTLDYISDGRGVTGREWFYIVREADGGRTLGARCEMDDRALARDVTLSVDDDWRPRDAYVRVAIDGAAVGSAHYAFVGASVHWQRFAAESVSTERVSLAEPATAFASHSLQNDAWMIAAFARARSALGVDELSNVIVCSKRPDGAEPPTLIRSTQRHRYVGEETLSVPAGRFDTMHYVFEVEGRPPIHYWLHGEDFLLVRCRWDLFEQTYQLTSLT